MVHSTVEEDEEVITPLPWKQTSAIIFLIVCEGVSMAYLFPFIVFMIIDFGTPENQVGYVAGLATSMFFIAQFLFITKIGSMSDTYGRRPIMLWGLTGNIVFCLLFGFSQSLPVALIIRFLTGAMNGNTAVGKTYLYDITDKTNQALAFSLREAGYNIGGFSGFLMSGFLARPCLEDGVLLGTGLCAPGSVMEVFPYLLPCIVTSFIALVALLVSYVFLTETLPTGGNSRKGQFTQLDTHEEELEEEETEETEEQQAHMEALNEMESKLFKYEHAASDLADTITTTEGDEEGVVDDQMIQDVHMCSVCCSSKSRRHPGVRSIFTAIYLYMLLAFVNMGFDEMVSVWATASLDRGGLSYSPREVGITLGSGAVFLILFSTMIYAPIERKLGGVKVIKYASVCVAVLMAIYPELHLLRVHVHASLYWTVQVILCALVGCCCTAGFAAINIIVSNTTTPTTNGKVSGLAFSMASISRLLAPVLGGSSFAFVSEHQYLYPFDYRLPFYILSLLAILMYVMVSCSMDESFNDRDYGIKNARKAARSNALIDEEEAIQLHQM